MSVLKKIFLYIFTICLIIFNYNYIFSMTMEEFVNDDRFCDGVLWGNENHARYEIQSKWSGEGCYAYCQEFVYECWGHEYNRPQLGISYSPNEYKNEVCAGDVIHKRWGNGKYQQHWFVVLERNGNKLRIAEGNYEYNCSPRVRVGWAKQDYYLSDSDWIVECYHAPKFANELTKRDNQIVDEIDVENEDNFQKTEVHKQTNTKRFTSSDNDSFWSEWQDEVISSFDTIEVETRQVPSSYIMVSFVCGVSGYPRGYYSWNKGSFRCDYTFEWTADEFDNAIVYHEGDYFDFYDGTAADGLIGGGGNAYVKDSDWYIPCYVRETKYKTQYRYKEIQKEVVNSNNTSTDNENHKSQTTQPTTKAITREKTYETSKSSIKEREDIVKENKKSKGKSVNGRAKVWSETSDNQNPTDDIIIIDEEINGENVKTFIPNMNNLPIETTQANQNTNSSSFNNIPQKNIDLSWDYHCVYTPLFQNFINDSRFRNGVSWNNDKQSQDYLFSRWWGYGCFAYCQEFAYYCFGKIKPKDGEIFYDATQIRAGDNIYIANNNGEHWFVCLGRMGDDLYVAEGNYNGKVRITKSDYKIINSKKINGTSYDFNYGFHYIPNIKSLFLSDRIGVSNSLVEVTQMLTGRTIRLFSKETNCFVTDSAEFKTVHADGDNSDGDVHFLVEGISDGWVGLKKMNGNYLSVKDQGLIKIVGQNITSNEKFKIYQFGDSFYLLNQKENKFIQVINDGIQIAKPLRVNRNFNDGVNGATWERFDILITDGK